MILQDQLPQSVIRLIDEDGRSGPQLLLTIATDLTSEGRCERQWLVASNEHLTVYTDSAQPTVLCSLRTSQVEAFRTDSVVGSGFFQARVDGIWVDVVRYSNTLAARFAAAAAALEAFRTTGCPPSQQENEPDKGRCQTCGFALAFEGDVYPRCIDSGAVVGRVWKLMKPYHRLTLLMCLLIVLGVVAELTPPKLQEYLVDHVLRFDAERERVQDLLNVLLILVSTLAVTRLALAIINSVKGVLASRVGTALTADLRAKIVERLQKLAVDYYDRHPVGVLLSRVTHDTEALYGLIHQFTSGFLLQVLQLLGVGVMLFLLNPVLALWTLIPMPFVLYGSWFFWRHLYPKYHHYWNAASKQAAALAGMLTGIRVVKAYAQEDHEFQRFRGTSDALRTSRSRVEMSAGTFSAIMQLVFSLGGLIVWYVGGSKVLRGEMTLGALMAFLAYLAMFYTPLASLAQFTTWLTSFLTASQRVFELLETPIGIRDPAEPVSLPHMQGLIRFENVTFGYDRKHPLLKNLDLEIRPGELIGVVGRSGSGKTTLVNLICRFYDVDMGKITIDGCDVRRIAREDLRSQIGVVLQEPFLFRGTVWENLVYGRPTASIEDALIAAKGANAHDFIMRLPFAYDTPLGERGAGLSGGEKQRLSIARALLYNPRILILDEATSSVDTESEKAIQDALTVLTRGRTTIAVSHRLSTLRNADRILVLDRGNLVEQGTHQELLALDGLYAKLVRIQTQLTADTALNGVATHSGGLQCHSLEGGSTNGNGHARSSVGAVEMNAQRLATGGEEAILRTLSLRCLTPENACIEQGDFNTVKLVVGDQSHLGIVAVQPLPATCPGKWVSLRCVDMDGMEHETGFVRDLAEWPDAPRTLLERTLRRRHYMRVITTIDTIHLKHGLLTFHVRTDRGPAQFTMRCSHSQVQDYGCKSKLLTDVEDNRFLIEDVDALSRREQRLFHRFVYW